MKKLITFLCIAALAACAVGEVLPSYKRVDSVVQQVELTLTGETILIAGASGVGYGYCTLDWAFPEGSQTILGAVADLNIAFSSTEPAAGSGIDVAVGTAGTTDGDVGDAGEATIIPSTGIDPFTNNTTDATAVLATVATQDGTASAKSVIINMLVDDADISGAATGTISGRLTITYTDNGDK